MITLDRFYNTEAWKATRKKFLLSRNELICDKCGKAIADGKDAVVHHIKELTEMNVNDPRVSLNPDNLMLVCKECHNKIHDRFGNNKGRGIYIVVGCPCSGKTTYVQQNAGRDDLILDVDKLWQAMSINQAHDHRDAIKPNVMNVRELIIDQIESRLGFWKNAWLIYSKNKPSYIEQLARRLRAEVIWMDTPKEICIDRAEHERDKFTIKLIEEYFQAGPRVPGDTQR